MPVSTGVFFPMRTEQVCERQGHGCGDSRGVALAVGEGVEGVAAFALADLGEMEVNHDFLERAVAKVGGDLSNGGTAFQHVGAEAMPQGMSGDVFVLFGESALGDGKVDGTPDGGFVHGRGAALEGLA